MVKNMLNMIRLLYGECRATNEELKKFQKGGTIWGNDTDPEELKRWTIEEKEEAEEEIAKFCCKSVRYNEYLTDIEEYALEYFEADENGSNSTNKYYKFIIDNNLCIVYSKGRY